MKIGVVSDTHGSAAVWEDVYQKFFSDTDLILHAGDVLYHGPRNPILPDYNPAELAQSLNCCPQPVVIAKGNCDAEVDALVLNMPLEAPYAQVFANGKRIILSHGHLFGNEEKKALAKQWKTDIFITGHIHETVLEKVEGTVFLNPGSPSMSKRPDHKATVALITEDQISIWDVQSQEILLSMNL